ncbi:Structural maintenance of chromosomes protein 2-1 [Camellia lanceoleosa]|uniref:Structural maintenance of chromosomes protein 2-1 n=1 Tax=Camellia lanceoleosa TaxID=1840588 RepID=A0ACC0GX67_9ERIC|nr:Structural maintenance of chromosomes protein 2-1 [Camellia lanceoleosa]
MEMEAVKQECASLESRLVSLKQQINSLTSEVDGLKTRMKERDTQISCILREQQELQHKISKRNLERKKMEDEVKRMEMEQKNCSLKVEKLIEKHAWITLEKHRLGRSGTDFDFASCDPHTARKDFEKLQAEQSGLKKQVNKKVMEMFEKSEDEYNHLISKKNVIKNDKTKINMVIAELDEKKKETLKVTWVKSLSELSGGQRSLLALPLILALHLFKPAPLYILDEFIVVSLKEGMFNNANVLFRTKFVDVALLNMYYLWRMGMQEVGTGICGHIPGALACEVEALGK